MTVFAAVKFKPSPPARVDRTATTWEKDQRACTEPRSRMRGELTEDGDIRIVVVRIAEALPFRHVCLAGELEVRDLHRIEDDFEDVK